MMHEKLHYACANITSQTHVHKEILLTACAGVMNKRCLVSLVVTGLVALGDEITKKLLLVSTTSA